ncbi:MAG: tetratricopeptide repeat protein [Zoogloeaceae bacterium]|nr:tetratricopeptide repeat protein [Zoogloeaceae bacterium]MCK6384917.1 tetratricopeptide repeat protein [Rhodocyclaceae bacterium]
MNYEHWRHYARGWLLHVFGREERAFNAYAAAYRAKPDDAQAARHLAFIASRNKQYDVADKWFVETLRLVPSDADTHFNHGFVLEQAGRSREAIAAFAEAARLKPSLDRAWYGMGMAHARLGEHAEAAAAFAKAAELQPMSGEVCYQWGMACHHAFLPDEVGKIVKRLVDFDPKRAMKLIKDAERPDLVHRVPEEVRRFFETHRH